MERNSVADEPETVEHYEAGSRSVSKDEDGFEHAIRNAMSYQLLSQSKAAQADELMKKRQPQSRHAQSKKKKNADITFTSATGQVNRRHFRLKKKKQFNQKDI